ncbi:MAG: ABC transporter substrate-binding protein [Treponema sp.]|jgi:NitT/TauT family transport system substrate-binding protein|nr:ABC transporter substrate-binding protein [Treponema sp.]
MKRDLQKLMLLVLAGCAAAMLPAQTSGKVTIYGLKGPSGVGMIRLFEEPPRAAGFEISVEALAQADLMAAKFIAGEAQIGILPPNVAAKIASSGKKIQIAAITGTGMLSLLSADPSVRRFEDLKGKTVEVAGQGATPDYVFRKILLSKGINPDRDLKLGYALAYPEIAQALIAGRVGLALLPEPFATMARNGNSSLTLVGDIQDEWIRLYGGANYPMTALVVDGAFAAANSGLVKTVLESLDASVKWVTANPAAAGALVEKHELGLRSPVVAAAIPRSNYVFISAAEARPGIEALFRAFLEFAPASIGGALPKDDFYYIPR